MNKRKLIGLVFMAGLIVPMAVVASTLTYQARLQDSGGLDIDGPVTAGFRIYDAMSGSTVLWGETQVLTANQGIIKVRLGEVNPLPSGLFNNPEIYIGITVAGESEMTPRKRLVSTWKAVSTKRANGKMVQAGGGAINVSGASTVFASIAFPEAFTSPPQVMLGAPSDSIGGVSFIPARVTNVTATGCDAHFDALDGATATGSANFDWIAIGE